MHHLGEQGKAFSNANIPMTFCPESAFWYSVILSILSVVKFVRLRLESKKEVGVVFGVRVQD